MSSIIACRPSNRTTRSQAVEQHTQATPCALLVFRLNRNRVVVDRDCQRILAGPNNVAQPQRLKFFNQRSDTDPLISQSFGRLSREQVCVRGMIQTQNPKRLQSRLDQKRSHARRGGRQGLTVYAAKTAPSTIRYTLRHHKQCKWYETRLQHRVSDVARANMCRSRILSRVSCSSAVRTTRS